jgi:DNA-binding XRE family transcriptional regulator
MRVQAAGGPGEGDDGPVAEQAALSFGRLLRQLRDDAGLTQEELADAARVSQRAISDLERGINLTARKDTARMHMTGQPGQLRLRHAHAMPPVGPAQVLKNQADVGPPELRGMLHAAAHFDHEAVRGRGRHRPAEDGRSPNQEVAHRRAGGPLAERHSGRTRALGSAAVRPGVDVQDAGARIALEHDLLARNPDPDLAD